MIKLKLLTQRGMILLISLLISGYGDTALAAKTKGEPLDGIVAVINDAVITHSELNDAMETVKKQMAASNVTLPPQETFRKQILDQMINKKLQLQLAEHMGIQVTDMDIDNAIRTIAGNNKITTDELYEKVNASGMTKPEYRKELHDQIAMQQVQQQAVASKLNISEQEVKDYIRSKAWQAFNTKEYHLEDILITLPENPTPQDVASAKKRADDLMVKLHKGLGFAEAAAAESGETNALQGGDLGWRKLPEVPALFSNELVHMKANELLGPVQAPNGFHIVKLSGIRTMTNTLSVAQQNQQVRELIFQRKLEEGIQNWLTKLHGEAFIDTHLDA